MPPTHTREVLVERFGNLKLPLGGKYEYKGVRGKQGQAHDKFQGYTQKKKHFTELFDKPQEAAPLHRAVRQASRGCCGPRHTQV